MKTKLVILILSLIFLATGCGKKGKSNAKFSISIGKLSGAGFGTTDDGGAMFYGKHKTKPDKFGINLGAITSSTLDLLLENGEWDFYGVVWDGVGSSTPINMVGAIKCASANQLLEGGDVNISINFNNAACANSLFAPAMDGPNFPGFKIETCRSFTNVTTGVAVVSAGNSVCDFSTDDKGHVGSYQVVLEEFSQGGSVVLTGTSLNSACHIVNAAEADGSAPTSASPLDIINIPQGNGIHSFKTTIRIFTDAACSGANGVKDIVLDNGLFAANDSGPDSSLKVYNYFDTSNNVFQVFHAMTGPEICGISTVDRTTDFSTGTGLPTNGQPLGICFPEQWDLIGTLSPAAATMTGEYIILKDLDFRNRMRLIPFATNAPVCGDLGNNIRPVGGLYTTPGSPCTGDRTMNTGAEFTGVLDGNEKTLSNILLSTDGFDEIGIIRSTASPAIIKNFVIENLQVEGFSQTGGLIGFASGTTISNIKIIKGDIQARGEDTGGVVGHTNGGGTITRAIVIDTEISSASDKVGGIVGYNGGGAIVEAYFDGDIEVNNGGSGSALLSYGGIVGELAIGSITLSSSRGTIIGELENVGGLIGNNSINGFISDSYSHMAIHSHKSAIPINMGGLVGLSSSGNITNAYFSGTLSDNCFAANNTCLIGEAKGTGGGGGVLLQVYATDDRWSDSTSLDLGGVAASTIYDDNISGTGLRRTAANQTTSYFGGGNAIWDYVDNRFPKLAWEATEIFDFCDDAANLDTVVNQILASRGSDADPIIICNNDQFADVKSYPAHSFKLKSNVNLFEVMQDFSDMAVSYSGTFDGNDHTLFGFDIVNGSGGTGGADLPTGVFSTINSTGVVKNVDFFAAYVEKDTAADTSFGIGVVAGKNSGVIKNVRVLASKVVAGLTPSPVDGDVGGIAGVNTSTGSISFVTIEYITLEGINSVGGIVGNNTGGYIGQAESYFSFFYSSAALVQNLGGIVGTTTTGGTIEEVSWGGTFDITDVTLVHQNIGGLAGYASTTSFKDVNTGSYGKIHVSKGNKVGGLIGEASVSTITRAYNAAEVSFGHCPDQSKTTEYACNLAAAGFSWQTPGTPANYGPIVGADVGGSASESNEVYFSGRAYSQSIAAVSSNLTMTAPTVENTTECEIVLDPASVKANNIYVTISSNYGVLVTASAGNDRNHNNYFDITTVDNSVGLENDDFRIDMDTTAEYAVTECTTMHSGGGSKITIVNPNGSNTLLGTKIFEIKLRDPDTYCTSGIVGGGDNAVCATGWDIVEDTEDINDDDNFTEGDFGAGFGRLIDAYLADIFGDPIPSTVPVWGLNPNSSGGDKYPRLRYHLH